MKKITIIGSGNGVTACAYHLAKNGHDVAIYDNVNFSKTIQSINDAENMIVAVDSLYEQKMKFPGKEKISLATTDPKIAANFSDI